MLVEITLTAGDAAETLADALLECGALSVSIEDADAGGADEQPLYGEPGFEPARHAWARSKLRVLAKDDGADAMIEAACAATQIEAAIETRVALEETDWVRVGRSRNLRQLGSANGYGLFPAGTPPPDDRAVIVRLDPGVAFGTGTHPTTRLCLAWLDTALAPASQRARLWLWLGNSRHCRSEARRRHRRWSRHRSTGTCSRTRELARERSGRQLH